MTAKPARTETYEHTITSLLSKRAELKRKGLSYAQLVEKLAAIVVVDKEVNVRNKLARGKFTAAFMLACSQAIGSETLRLS